MEVEISRRRFLQGSVALSVIGGTTLTATNLLSNEEEKGELKVTTKTGRGKAVFVPTLCEMCVNKCAAIARVEKGVVTKLNPNPFSKIKKYALSERKCRYPSFV